MSYPHRFYAIVIPGLEEVAAKELEQLSAHEIKLDNGGIHFSGTMETMFRVNLRSRTVTRVLLRLKRFTAMTLNEIRTHCEQVDWAQFLNDDSSVSVHASCHKSKLMHTKKLEDEISSVIGKLGFSNKEGSSHQQIFIRIENNRCLLSIDTSGERLDRRGYRLESGKAPVRETLAAGVLQWMEWSPEEPLMVPMCGSGTFAIEAAITASHRSPNLMHEFSFLGWPRLKQRAWKKVKEKSISMAREECGELPIYASDFHPGAVAITGKNAQRAGVDSLIHIEQRDVKELTGPVDATTGVIICNPPYGDRINADVRGVYAALGKVFKESFDGWRMGVFSPEVACEKALGLPVKKKLKIKHGGKWIYILDV